MVIPHILLGLIIILVNRTFVLMDIRGFLRPTVFKIILTVLLPVPVYVLFTLSVWGVLDFYFWLLTPYIKVYADVMYTEFNSFVLLWIPFYLAACLIVELFNRRG